MDFLSNLPGLGKKPEDAKPEEKKSSPLERRMGSLDIDKAKKISDSFKKIF